MRIDKISPQPPCSPVAKSGQPKIVAGKSAGADRVELARRPTTEQVQSKIQESIRKAEQKNRAERLDALKQKVSEGRYFVSTDALVNALWR